MAWKKQAFKTLVKRGEFYAGKDGLEAELSKGETDGELYVRVFWPANEHGKEPVPTSMQLKNWRRLFENGDHIEKFVAKAENMRENLRRIEAEQAQYKAEITKLNESRTAFPDVFTDEVYGKKADAIRAKYPHGAPPKVVRTEEVREEVIEG